MEIIQAKYVGYSLPINVPDMGSGPSLFRFRSREKTITVFVYILLTSNN